MVKKRVVHTARPIWSLNPGSPFVCMGKLFNFSWSQFPHQKNGANSSKGGVKNKLLSKY